MLYAYILHILLFFSVIKSCISLGIYFGNYSWNIHIYNKYVHIHKCMYCIRNMLLVNIFYLWNFTFLSINVCMPRKMFYIIFLSNNACMIGNMFYLMSSLFIIYQKKNLTIFFNMRIASRVVENIWKLPKNSHLAVTFPYVYSIFGMCIYSSLCILMIKPCMICKNYCGMNNLSFSSNINIERTKIRQTTLLEQDTVTSLITR